MDECVKLICILNGRGGIKPLSGNELYSWDPSMGVRWLHFDYTHHGSALWLDEKSGLDPLVTEALLSEESRPRSSRIGDGLLIALRGVNMSPGSDPEDMVAIRIWIEPGQIISSQKRDLLSVKDLFTLFVKGEGPGNCGDFLTELLERLTDRSGDIVDNIEDSMSELEESLILGDCKDMKHSLSPLRRQVIYLKRYLAPQRVALEKIQGEKVSWLSETQRLTIREISNRLIRHLEELDAIRDRAKVTHDEIQGIMSEDTGKRMYLLSIIAAIFIPLGFLTGLMGINLGGIPGAENPLAFMIFLALIMIVLLVQIIFFKFKGWF